MIVFPNAKINIGLHVVSKRNDGYHNLETVMYPVKLTDALEVADSGTTEFTVSGLLIDGLPEHNLVYKAYLLLKRDFNLPELKLHLHKVIPFGAGLGGGSSDAAFALKLLNDYFCLNIKTQKLNEYAAKIGADCPFFILNKPAFATGIGDILDPIGLDLSSFEIVILKPPVSVNTAEAYKNIKPRNPVFNLMGIGNLPVENWKENVVNDFEETVFHRYPQIKLLKETLYELGALFASMSGSGSAVYGIFRRLPTDIHKFVPNAIYNRDNN